MSSGKAKRPHLGRGLEALLGPITVGPSEQEQVPVVRDEHKYPRDKELEKSKSELPLSSIRPNPYQPRQFWDENELKELAESIRQNGVIQPILVRPAGDGQYEIIAGERRFRAAQIAGLSAIPVLIRQATEEQMLELALVENIHRADLNPIERAQAYQKYIQSFSLTQTEAAQRLGEDRSVVSNYLRLLDLPADVQEMLKAGQLSMGHARAILALQDEEVRRKLANRAMAGRLSVREVEQIVRRLLQRDQQTNQQKKEKAAYILDLEKRLETILGTKVRIEPGRRGSRGRIIIEYYSLDEFERLAQSMGMSSTDVL
ncbi:MAG TPA: ParB/RepB/Spo0J family partition protein [Anaerohalosphaeraceae bacterium]|nr:ParB/RepB/Spo0J family partition protein [Anaerohalosphaeraceae bacterium]HPB93176.1 ParB/RepB/Spo0J family partition protein [Anaerohalosphaeraceae bacterium]HRT22567.1 ParB/RepB/Spo0J family partition protein [Anaerohalosphaeraceae bacterium]